MAHHDFWALSRKEDLEQEFVTEGRLVRLQCEPAVEPNATGGGEGILAFATRPLGARTPHPTFALEPIEQGIDLAVVQGPEMGRAVFVGFLQSIATHGLQAEHAED